MLTLLEQKKIDTTNVDKTYKYWRIRTMLGMYIGYAFYYFTRKGLVFVLPDLVNSLHLSKTQIGLFGTVFYFTYGLSKFFSGMVSDRVNPRYFMAAGLIITGITNILFGLSSSLALLLLFWFINSIFQGWGWPPCAKLLTHWYSQKERGIWWGVWNTSHTIGAVLIPIIAGVIASLWGWRSAMFFFGAIAIVMGIVVFNRLGNTPEKMGLPPIEEYKNDYPTGSKEPAPKVSTKEILFKYILSNKYIWVLAFSSFVVYFVRIAFIDWGSLYLTQKGYSLISADSCLSFFEFGGFFGSLIAGWCSDKIFHGMRGPVNVLFSACVLFSVLAFWAIPGVHFVLQSMASFAIGFFIFGPQMVLGIAAAELSHREAAGTATGFLAIFAYLGAALSGYPIGAIIQDYGWNGFFISMCVCSVLSVLFLLPLWNVKARKA